MILFTESGKKLAEDTWTRHKTLAKLFMSLGVKLLVLVLSIFGITNMWLAVFSDVGIMVIAVLNSIRLLYTYKRL